MKHKITKELSTLATGIRNAETPISAVVDGVKKQAKSIKIEIDSELNMLKVSYMVHYFNNKGVALNIEPKKETVIIRDEAEAGEVDIDETTLEQDMSTYVMETPEKLTVTNWNTQLGDIVIGSAIELVKSIEGIK